MDGGFGGPKVAIFSKDLVLEGTLLGESCVSGLPVSVTILLTQTKQNDPLFNKNTAEIGIS